LDKKSTQRGRAGQYSEMKLSMIQRTRLGMRRLWPSRKAEPIDPEILRVIHDKIQLLGQLGEPQDVGAEVQLSLGNRVERLLVQGLQTYGGEVDFIRYWARLRNERSFFPNTGMYDWLEAQVLYLLIRCVKPEVVVEISPNYGYSTGFLLLAMNKNKRGKLYSFDLEEKFHRHALRSFNQVGIDTSRQLFFAADVREAYDRVFPKQVDVLFMDSDHSYDFAQWYIANLYPRVTEGGLIHAHDVLRHGVKPHLGDKGEGRAIWEFIQERQVSEKDYLYVSELVRSQPIKLDVLQQLERYPFGETQIGSNNIEQCTSFWIVKHF